MQLAPIYWKDDLHAVTVGDNANGCKVYTLWATHFRCGNELCERSEPEYLKAWTEPEFAPIGLDADIQHEITLNDWSRWNQSLPIGQKVEISDAIYYHLLECVPPRRMDGSYFEVGEAHHHDTKGRAIYRACWMEGGKYFTGYPKTIADPVPAYEY